MEIECKTQKECNQALTDGNIPLLVGDGNFMISGKAYVVARESSHVEAWGSSHVEAWGSSYVVARESSYVVARGSSHVVAWGSSYVVAWGSSHVEARESSYVEARESSHVVAWGSSYVEASKFVTIYHHSKNAKVNGGVIIVVEQPRTPAEWCELYGVPHPDPHVILFKAVDANFFSPRKTCYAPGHMPEAKDWDGIAREWGGGLHLSPHPVMALEFNSEAVKFVACPVALEDIVVYPNAEYPQKIKAKKVCAPCYEVDREGNKI